LHYDNKLQKLFVKNHGFVSSVVDSLKSRYDQVKGRDLVGYFQNGKLAVMDVLGNGQTIYYAQEQDGKYTGVNKAICSDIQIKFNNGKINRIKFITMPEATFFPINQFPNNYLKLEGFTWKGEQKPQSLSELLGNKNL